MSPTRPDLVACWLFRLDADGRPEVLLIRRAPGRLYPGLWQCVTGKLEAGERVTDGALREVAEETGLARVDLEAVFETDIVNWFHEGSADAIWCEAVFAARVRPGTRVALSPEHDDLRWLDPAGAKELVVWPAYERAIDQVVWLVDHPGKAEHYRLVDSES
ncbi:MAG TPA: NUDIX domain-containing protein [Candidatus Limnocylindrales bacterium]|nr:NUDIX domain-containing protein [Candidatus Limnocylindrales bacterium]